jgi:hypothetical protein
MDVRYELDDGTVEVRGQRYAAVVAADGRKAWTLLGPARASRGMVRMAMNIGRNRVPVEKLAGLCR